MASKVALITGASSGIGRAAALALARDGFSLSVSGRNGERLAAVTKECQTIGAEVIATRADLCKEADVLSLFEATRNKFGRLDALINNAGILELGSIENTSLDQFDRLINTNVRSIYQLTQLCLPLLKEFKGSIVNVSSVNGIRSFPNVLAYNISKAALDQFTRCVALELAPYEVRCNSVNPGVTVTGLQRAGGLTEQQYAEFLEKSRHTHALGRPGEPDEVAAAILFLADPNRSSFITGANLPVDGGRHAMCPR